MAKTDENERPAVLPTRTRKARPAPHRADPTDPPRAAAHPAATAVAPAEPASAAVPSSAAAPTSAPIPDPDPLLARRRRRPEPTLQLNTRVSVAVRDLVDDEVDRTGRRGDLRKVIERVVTDFWGAGGAGNEDTARALLAQFDGTEDEGTVQLASRVSKTVRDIADGATESTGLSLRAVVEAAVISQLGEEARR